MELFLNYDEVKGYSVSTYRNSGIFCHSFEEFQEDVANGSSASVDFAKAEIDNAAGPLFIFLEGLKTEA